MFDNVTRENINEYLQSGQLRKAYLISPDFGGSEDIGNQIILTPSAAEEKLRSDDELYNALVQNKSVSGFHADLEYKNGTQSIVPTKIIISANIDGDDYRRVIEVW